MPKNMKNFLLYVSPQRQFDSETSALVKVQIDNSLTLGWAAEDVVLVTNFPYEYRSIRATVVGDGLEAHGVNTKGWNVATLLDLPILPQDTLWLHDFDAFQLVPFDDPLARHTAALALTDYGWRPQINGGSIFFRPDAVGFFRALRAGMELQQQAGLKHGEEIVMQSLIGGAFSNCFVRLDCSYNFGMRHIDVQWRNSTKPIKVAHFHPAKRGAHVWNAFCEGDNPIRTPLVPDRLRQLLEEHGCAPGDRPNP
jgi:hypothetical protein